MKKETSFPTYITPVFLAIAFLGILWRLIFIFRDMPHLINFPLIDDSFYSLGIARNFAMGLGFTHDGVVQTNGFQPLFVMLSAPLYYIFPNDKMTPVYIVLLAQTLLSFGTGYIIYRLAREGLGKTYGLIAAFLWFVPVTMFKFDINGLETGLYAFFVMLSVYIYIRHIRHFEDVSMKKGAVFGVVLGLSVLSRNDAFFLVLAFIIDFLLLHKKKIARDNAFLKKAVKPIGTCELVFIITIAPWFYFNITEFGSLIPRSGKAVRILSQKFLYSGNINFADNPTRYCINNLLYSFKRLINQSAIFEPITWFGTYINKFEILSYFILGILAFTALFLLLDRRKFKDFWKTDLAIFRFAWIYAAIMIIAYSFFVFGQHHFPRYYFPIHVIFLFIIVGIIKYFNFRFPPYFKVLWVLISVFFFILVNIGNIETYKYWEHNHGLATYFQTSACRQKHFGKNDILGAFQSGTMGYFSEQRVINLDGVVNTKASESIANRTMLEYIKSQKINYIVDTYFQYRALLGKNPDEMILDKDNFELLDDCYVDNDRIRIFRIVYNKE